MHAPQVGGACAARAVVMLRPRGGTTRLLPPLRPLNIPKHCFRVLGVGIQFEQLFQRDHRLVKPPEIGIRRRQIEIPVLELRVESDGFPVEADGLQKFILLLGQNA